MAKRLFGTDGIRGEAGAYPLDEATVLRVGEAVTRLLRGAGRQGRVVIGYDTRESSVPICARLAEGIRRAGGTPAVAGVIPTPGVAFLTRVDGYDAGIVVSASHNPFHDNGIKVFQANGTKLSDADEAQVEAMVLNVPAAAPSAALPRPDHHPMPTHMDLSVDRDLAGEYVRYLAASVPARERLRGARVVADCANGASASVAPRLFEALGVDAVFLGDSPDGRNINKDCGSLYPQQLAAAVKENRAALGVAFDGDADRCLAVDETGFLLDGDFILYLAGRDLKRRKRLRNDTVVATVMSNLWLEQRLGAEGIRLLRTPVGDKYVLEEMINGDHVLGGEQSGHVIFRESSTTGDGLLTALMLMSVWRADGRRLSEMVAGITPCPQVLLNVRVEEKPNLEQHPALGSVIRKARKALGSNGRLLVRYSGTEPLARVMTEGNDADEIRRIADEVAEAIRRTLS